MSKMFFWRKQTAAGNAKNGIMRKPAQRRLPLESNAFFRMPACDFEEVVRVVRTRIKRDGLLPLRRRRQNRARVRVADKRRSGPRSRARTRPGRPCSCILLPEKTCPAWQPWPKRHVHRLHALRCGIRAAWLFHLYHGRRAARHLPAEKRNDGTSAPRAPAYCLLGQDRFYPPRRRERRCRVRALRRTGPRKRRWRSWRRPPLTRLPRGRLIFCAYA